LFGFVTYDGLDRKAVLTVGSRARIQPFAVVVRNALASWLPMESIPASAITPALSQ